MAKLTKDKSEFVTSCNQCGKIFKITDLTVLKIRGMRCPYCGKDPK
jgi:DNA-directed RNA polymerase subunit RPC12/RpoP